MSKDSADATRRITLAASSFTKLDDMALYLEKHRETEHLTGDFVIMISNSARFPDSMIDMTIISKEPTIPSCPTRTWPRLDHAIAWLSEELKKRR